jgi:hypothetical protein
MNAKEKAKELFDKYLNMENVLNVTELPYMMLSKKCALIAVDEIIDSTPLDPTNVDWDDSGASFDYWYSDRQKAALEYWQQVKTEIEKL